MRRYGNDPDTIRKRKHKDKKMNNLNQIEKLADDFMNVLTVCGMKYYQEMKGKFKDDTN